MHTIVTILHVLAASAIVVLVLVQHGKGADMGAAFGSGSSGSLFGSSGAANFLSRATGALAAVFFVTSLGLTFFSASTHKTGGVTQTLVVPSDAKKSDVQPAVPAPSAPAPSGAPASKSAEIPK